MTEICRKIAASPNQFVYLYVYAIGQFGNTFVPPTRQQAAFKTTNFTPCIYSFNYFSFIHKCLFSFNEKLVAIQCFIYTLTYTHTYVHIIQLVSDLPSTLSIIMTLLHLFFLGHTFSCDQCNVCFACVDCSLEFSFYHFI